MLLLELGWLFVESCSDCSNVAFTFFGSNKTSDRFQFRWLKIVLSGEEILYHFVDIQPSNLELLMVLENE